jgi:hypothetical protein
VTYFRWQGANAMACTQQEIEACLSGKNKNCVKHAVPYSNQKGSCTPGTTSCIDTPITDAMTPSMNLWSNAPPKGIWGEAKLTLGAFHYFPGSTPAPTPVPPTPSPTPPPKSPSQPRCCWSAWGTSDVCGLYPSGKSGAGCNTDWDKTCNSHTDCATVTVHV